MLAFSDEVLPSSPNFNSKSSWEEVFGEFFPYEFGMICPTNILHESTPRTDSALPISMVRQVPYSPVIKQESDCGYSQPDYVYNSTDNWVPPTEPSGFATPKFGWEFLPENLSPAPADLFMPQSPLECSRENSENSDHSPDYTFAPPSQNYVDVLNVPQVKRKRQKRQLLVTLRFREYKPFLGVIHHSGPKKEYRLPIFANLVTLDSMVGSGKYKVKETPNAGSSVELLSQIPKKRYVSRLTRSQLALILGIQDYSVALVKDIESIILSMCDQLCGLKIGECSWSRSVPQDSRRASVIKVYQFAKLYFPSFSMDHIQTIIKRGAYSRTQEFLRRKRRRERKYTAELDPSLLQV